MFLLRKNLVGIAGRPTFAAENWSMKAAKKVLVAMAMLLTMAAAQASSVALDGAPAEISEIVPEITLTVHGQSVRVQNAAKQILYVYNLTGQCIAQYRVESEDKTLNIDLPKSIYILKVGNVVRKVALK